MAENIVLTVGTRILFRECTVCIRNHFLLTSGGQGETPWPDVVPKLYLSNRKVWSCWDEPERGGKKKREKG